MSKAALQKGKVIPKIKAAHIPVFDGLIPLEAKVRFGIICSTGCENAYRLAFARGEGASTKEVTWNKAQHRHICCDSKVAWRHRASCSNAVRNMPDDLSDLKETI